MTFVIIGQIKRLYIKYMSARAGIAWTDVFSGKKSRKPFNMFHTENCDVIQAYKFAR